MAGLAKLRFRRNPWFVRTSHCAYPGVTHARAHKSSCPFFPCKDHAPSIKTGAKVTLCGAATPMGQFIALQLKVTPLVCQINLYDCKDTFGMACDLNHITSKCKVKSFHGPNQLKAALQDVDLALILSGSSWQPGMTSEDLFKLNAGIVRTLAEATAFFCPEALVGVISKPINSFVPLINEVYKLSHVYNPDKVIGMATYEVMKANTIVALTHYLDASCVHIPIIGGVTDSTTVPLFSLAKPYSDFSRETVLELTSDVRHAEHRIAEETKHPTEISIGFAAARFASTLIRGLFCHDDAVMSAYVRSNALPHVKYFTTQLKFGQHGVMKNYGVPKLSVDETMVLEQVVPYLLDDIKRAEEYIKENTYMSSSTCNKDVPSRPTCPLKL